MATTWEEVSQAVKENRHELVFTGSEISRRIENNGFDESVFSLEGLNFLEISKTCLKTISNKIGALHNITNLVLHGNKLTSLPDTIGKLSKLKLLDVSRNELESFPDCVEGLTHLHTLNVSCNKLSSFPNISPLVELHILDLSHNQLECLPEGITSPELSLLAQVFANSNQLSEIPNDLSELPSLKTLDISENKLSAIPPEISECIKLKEFKYGGNKLKDRKLGRMWEQCSTKAILDYLGNILEKERKQSGGKKSDKDKKKRKRGKSKSEDVEDLSKNLMRVLKFPEETGHTVEVHDDVLNVRPYIVCCIVRHLNFSKSRNMFKRFITLQTKLHETVCQKRQTATIATHDLQAIKEPLTYMAKPPSTMMLVPLGKKNEISAVKLMGKLRQDAEELRKEKKRNTVSGIHKYLDLLKGQALFPCLCDRDGVIISFPPITNCEATKVSKETSDILIEVTSSTSLDTCKKVVQELLQRLLEMGVGSDGQIAGETLSQNEADADEGGAVGGDEGVGEDGLILTQDQILVVEQVKVVDSGGSLKVIYPSRVDLQGDGFRIIRE